MCDTSACMLQHGLTLTLHPKPDPNPPGRSQAGAQLGDAQVGGQVVAGGRGRPVAAHRGAVHAARVEDAVAELAACQAGLPRLVDELLAPLVVALQDKFEDKLLMLSIQIILILSGSTTQGLDAGGDRRPACRCHCPVWGVQYNRESAS